MLKRSPAVTAMVERKSTDELQKMTKAALAEYARERFGIQTEVSAYAKKADIIKWIERMEDAEELLLAIEEEAGI